MRGRAPSEGSFRASSSCWRLRTVLGVPWLVDALRQLLGRCHLASPCLCVCPCLFSDKDTSRVGAGPILFQYDLIVTCLRPHCFQTRSRHWHQELGLSIAFGGRSSTHNAGQTFWHIFGKSQGNLNDTLCGIRGILKIV